MESTQYRVFIAVICSFCLWGAIAVLTGTLLPNIITSFDLSTIQAGLLISFWSVSFVIGSWISARVLNFYKLNTIFIVASGLTLIALMALYQTQTLWLFTLAFGVIGVMMGVSVTIGHSLIGVSFPVKRTAMLSTLDVVFTLGSISAPLGVIAISSGGLDWHIFYFFLGILFAILIAIVYFYLPIIFAPQDQGPESKSGILSHINRPYLIFLGLTGVFLGTVEWAQNSWIVTYALAKDSSETIAQLGFAIYLGGMLIVRILTIFMSNWMQTGRNSTYLLSLALLGNIILLYSSGTAYFMLGNFLIGFGMGAIFPIALGRAMDFYPKKAATSSATLLMGVICGSQIAALFLGWLADQSGGIDEAFRATTPFFILLIACYAIFRGKSKGTFA